jgi:Homing endonuclease associated repeat
MRSGPRGDGLVWTHDTILYAIELWTRRHGHPPSAREWDRAGEDHPSRQTVQRVFGRWNRAIRDAGYRPRRPGELRRRDAARDRDELGRFVPLPATES